MTTTGRWHREVLTGSMYIDHAPAAAGGRAYNAGAAVLCCAVLCCAVVRWQAHTPLLDAVNRGTGTRVNNRAGCVAMASACRLLQAGGNTSVHSATMHRASALDRPKTCGCPSVRASATA